MLHINNKDYSEERKNSEPLSFEEQNEVVKDLNLAIIQSKMDLGNDVLTNIQRLLYHYENLQAFYDIQGGWDGVNRLRDKANAYDNQWIDVNKRLPVNNEDVLVAWIDDGMDDTEEPFKTVGYFQGEWITYQHKPKQYFKVTYWMPLPKSQTK